MVHNSETDSLHIGHTNKTVKGQDYNSVLLDGSFNFH